MSIDIDYVRSQFPALERIYNGFPVAYLDGPGGTQVPQRVIDKVVRHLTHHNANIHGTFISSIENDEVIQNAREAFAAFFGCAWKEVSFCQNATTINFKLSQAMARDMKPGDEILITDIDHGANRSPWQILEERGIASKSARIDKASYTIDMADFKQKLSGRTRVVALNYASNAVGTISDVKTMIGLAHDVGAITVVDAVHFAPHGVIDVRDIDTDYLFCSAYKFFGPHVGILYAKAEQMERLRTLKVEEQEDVAPDKFETGTLNHEGIAGAAEAVDFIEDIGVRTGDRFSQKIGDLEDRRKHIVAGMLAIEEYERPLADSFREELTNVPGVKVYSPPEDCPKTSTVSFTVDGVHPHAVAKHFASKGICVWDGDFYVTQVVQESGGWVRVGLAPYNTQEELDRTLDAIRSL